MASSSTRLRGRNIAALDPSIKVPYDPALAAKLLAASGYSRDKPVKFTIQTTRGFKPKDYEMIQAIVGMWRNVGIDAHIEVYEIAKHFELRMTHKLAPAAFYNWGNYIGDPTTSTGFAMWSKSPHSAWHSDDLDAKITPLWSEKDEAKRIQGWKDADRYIAEQGYVLPLLQYAQPILYKSDLKVTHNHVRRVAAGDVDRESRKSFRRAASRFRRPGSCSIEMRPARSGRNIPNSAALRSLPISSPLRGILAVNRPPHSTAAHRAEAGMTGLRRSSFLRHEGAPAAEA